MNIVFLTHPTFVNSQSMPRFAKLLAEGMKKRGHSIEIWTPKPTFARINISAFFKKWLGYIDQYVLFPMYVRKHLPKNSHNTLFVITDNALGPWVPLIANRPHVIHCHDFLAQLSAMNKIPENKTGWTGKQYQRFIHRGYSHGKYFLSVSENTMKNLHQLLPKLPIYSKVVYNGLNQEFTEKDHEEAKYLFSSRIGINTSSGYILHVGGNQWYKNRKGVIEIYDALRLNSTLRLPLVMIGQYPSKTLRDNCSKSLYKDDIFFISGIDNDTIRLAYAGASVFLFPSLAEGFGWPIAEAMASGCPVITTGEAPMTEVAGDAGFYISRRPYSEKYVTDWAIESAKIVENVLELNVEKRKALIEAGLKNSQRFNGNRYLDELELIYQKIIDENSASDK